ncbi:MAG TPA: hypothetical protein PLB02_06565 [Thermoanaerobaculia bacterium]|nr:hypothetical protein [Thermoanaerobaculia bacterium]HQR67038.1 hypothetical protein [Thermoanaerobaculia bacterium]
MKLLMVIVEESCKEQVEVILGRAGVRGFTEIPGVAGIGATGPRLGSAAFPKTSAVILTLLEDGEVTRVGDAIRAGCPASGRAHLITWTAEALGG